MRTAFLAISAVAVSFAQTIAIPDGTKLRVKLDQTISSASATEGQVVELIVTDALKIDDTVVIPEGARVTGTIVMAQEKRRMGRAGKLDFSVDRVRAIDGEWIPLRYSPSKRTGDSHATRNGIITAGVAVVFWPAAPFVLLAKGKDVTINKGVIFDVFTDQNHVAKLNGGAAPVVASAGTSSAAPNAAKPAQPQATGEPASILITSAVNGADIEVDGAFVGSTPTTVRLTPGPHTVAVRHGNDAWTRVVHITAGSNVTVHANLPATQTARVAAR